MVIVQAKSCNSKVALMALCAAICGPPSVTLLAANDQQQAPLVYSAWTKVCVDGHSTDLSGCFTGREGRTDAGQVVVATIVADIANKPVLRILLPLGMQSIHGTRVIIDNKPPMQAPYLSCVAKGCISEYQLSSELRANLKRGQNLVVQAINSNGSPLTLPVPLAGFEAALSGSPSDPHDIDRDQVAAQNKSAPATYLADPRVALLPGKVPEASSPAPILTYAPWTKFCLKGQEAKAKQVCFTGKDGRLETGQPIVAAVIIEPEGESKKILRVTLPLGMQMMKGTRVLVDNNPAKESPYVICFANGCMSDYELTPDLLANMKKGQNLMVQAVNSNGAPLTLPLPLAEFAKAYDGMPTDPKVFEETQNKLQEELQKRATLAKAGGQAQAVTAPAVPTPVQPQASTALPARASPSGRRVALVIGNSAYKAMPPLKNPINDATDVGDALKRLGFDTLVATDLTRTAMNDAVDRFSRKVNGADVALVYYSGHGMQLNGKNYLLPIDADLQSLADINRYRLLPLDDLVDVMQSAKGPQLIILDACRNNPVERDFKNKFASAAGGLSRDGNISRGFERIDARNGLVVVYSTASNSVAADGSDRNSPFTKVFLQDVGMSGLEFREMLFQVQRDVYQATKEQQLPEISSLYIGPIIHFAP